MSITGNHPTARKDDSTALQDLSHRTAHASGNKQVAWQGCDRLLLMHTCVTLPCTQV